MKTNHPRMSRIDATPAGIPTEEPVFLLRAQDRHAAAAIRFYADRVAAANGDPSVVASSRQMAVAFDAWPVKKAPDRAEREEAPVPPPLPEGYTATNDNLSAADEPSSRGMRAARGRRRP